MRILYVTSRFPFDYSEAFLAAEVRELARQGHAVRLVPMRSGGKVSFPDMEAFLASETTQAVLSRSILQVAGSQIWRRPTAIGRGMRRIATVVPRHLVKNAAVLLKGVWLGRIAREWGAEHIHVHWAGTTASMGLVASEISGVPWSFTAHRWDILENNLLGAKVAHAAFARFISNKSLDAALRLGVSRSAKTFVLPMGVSVDNMPCRESCEEPSQLDRAFRFLVPAALVPVKGHVYVLEAAQRLASEQFEIWFAGDGELRNELGRRARELGIERRVRFLGQLPHCGLLDLYRREEVDAVVLASIEVGGLHEGIPVSLIEAMAHGVPVIATRSGGTPELLEGGAGALIPPCDSDALASAMSLVWHEQSLRRQLSRTGRERVCKNFAIEPIVSELVERFQGGGRV